MHWVTRGDKGQKLIGLSVQTHKPLHIVSAAVYIHEDGDATIAGASNDRGLTGLLGVLHRCTESPPS